LLAFAMTSLQARAATLRRMGTSPWTSKGGLTNEVIDLAKPSREGHTRGQRSTDDKADPMAKSTIGFKDDRTINDHEVIK
jgi:hypothetical protein